MRLNSYYSAENIRDWFLLCRCIDTINFNWLQKKSSLCGYRTKTRYYSFQIFFFPPKRFTRFVTDKLNNKIFRVECVILYIYLRFCMLKYSSKCWVNLAWIHIYFCHFTKINTIYNVELFSTCVLAREIERLNRFSWNQCKNIIDFFTIHFKRKSCS